MANLQKENLNILNVLVIYISEAHAKDEWPISHLNITNQHKNLKERITAARGIEGNNNFLRIFCDSFGENNFENNFAAWPERAFLLKGNKVQYISQHKVDGIDDWYTEVERIVKGN